MRILNNIFFAFLLAMCTLCTTDAFAASATADMPTSIDQQEHADDEGEHPNAFGIHQPGEMAVTLLEQLPTAQSVEDLNDEDGLGTNRRPKLDLSGTARYYLDRSTFKSGRLQKLLFPFHTHL